MIELCSSSGRKVDDDSCVRCVCGQFWYGANYPVVENHKRKIVDEVPWHNIKGHIIDKDKWERRTAEIVKTQQYLDKEKQMKQEQEVLKYKYVTSGLYTKPSRVL